MSAGLNLGLARHLWVIPLKGFFRRFHGNAGLGRKLHRFLCSVCALPTLGGGGAILVYFRWPRQHACGLFAPGRGKKTLSGHKASSAGNPYVDFPPPDDHTTNAFAPNTEFHQHLITPQHYASENASSPSNLWLYPKIHSTVGHMGTEKESVDTNISGKHRRRVHLRQLPWIVAPGEGQYEDFYTSK